MAVNHRTANSLGSPNPGLRKNVMKAALLILLFTFAAIAKADDLPDAPLPSTHAPSHEHGYLGTPITKAAFASSVASRSWDAAYTCHLLGENRGWREATLPVQSCRGVALWSAGAAGAGYGGQALFHKLGWHKVESLPHWASAAFAIGGVVYSYTHHVQMKPGSIPPRPVVFPPH